MFCKKNRSEKVRETDRKKISVYEFFFNKAAGSFQLH